MKRLRNLSCTSIPIVCLVIFFLIFWVEVGCRPLQSSFEKSSFESNESGKVVYKEVSGEGKPTRGEESEITIENSPPIAVIDVYQPTSDGFSYEKGNPVYFSASGSMDPDGDNLTYVWTIDKEKILGEKVSYIFENTGEYEVSLAVSDGNSEASISETINVVELASCIVPTKEHRCSVEVTYLFENKGPRRVVDLECLVETPQTYLPFQVVQNEISKDEEGYKIFDDDWNLITLFKLGDLLEGESKSVSVSYDVVIYEYDFNKECEGLSSVYRANDKDLELYTVSEPYIDCNSSLIVETVKSVIGNETSPVIIAEKLYQFVASELEYDNQKIERNDFRYLSASEVLKAKKGVCADYSILYAALCRAAGIPARLAGGIPIFAILSEKNYELHHGHAWVEIKLPGYGWIPIDITSEAGFMSYDCSLNLQTYRGSGMLHKSLTIEGKSYYPTGFSYSWEGGSEPNVYRDVIYKVSGIDPDEITVIAEGAFIGKVYNLLGEYNAALNHVNVYHKKGWIFNDPQEIALEETFLVKLKELYSKLERFSYPNSYANHRANLLKLAGEICFYKEAQINCMKNNDYEGSLDNYYKFTSTLDTFFGYYNQMSSEYNRRY